MSGGVVGQVLYVNGESEKNHYKSKTVVMDGRKCPTASPILQLRWFVDLEPARLHNSPLLPGDKKRTECRIAS